ncbi:hypothetical protein FOZ63_030530, partial [Perkinsus olseni]
ISSSMRASESPDPHNVRRYTLSDPESSPIPSHTTPHEYLVVNFRNDRSLICDNFAPIFRELHHYMPPDVGYRVSFTTMHCLDKHGQPGSDWPMCSSHFVNRYPSVKIFHIDTKQHRTDDYTAYGAVHGSVSFAV